MHLNSFHIGNRTTIRWNIHFKHSFNRIIYHQITFIRIAITFLSNS